jgi:hypothetical protein
MMNATAPEASSSLIIIEHGEGADKTRVALPPGTPGDVILLVAKGMKEKG